MGKTREKRKNAASPLLERITLVYTAVLCSVGLLLPGLRGYTAAGRSAFFFCAGLSLCYLAALALAAAEIALTGGGRLRELLRPLTQLRGSRVCFLLYAAWAALSAACSEYEGVWLGLGRYEGLLFIFICVAVYWAVSAYGRWDDRLLILLGAVLFINLALGLLQYAGANPLGLFPEGVGFHDAFVLYNGRFLGTLGNVDVLGGFLCLSVPLFYGAYLMSGRNAALAPLAAGGVLLALADVDAAYMGLPAALALTLPWYCRVPNALPRICRAVGTLALSLAAGGALYADREMALCLRLSPAAALLAVLGAVALGFGVLAGRSERLCRPGSERLPRRLWAALAALAVLGMGLVYLLPVSSGTLGQVHEMLHGTVDPAFGSGRIRIWDEVVHLIGQAPLLGGGPDTLVARMGFTFTRWSSETGTMIEAAVDSAHNDFLNIAVNLGLPALAFYIAGLVCWFRSTVRRHPRAAGIILPGVTAYLVQICFTVSASGVILLFWILLALCERDINLPNCKEEDLK